MFVILGRFKVKGPPNDLHVCLTGNAESDGTYNNKLNRGGEKKNDTWEGGKKKGAKDGKAGGSGASR